MQDIIEVIISLPSDLDWAVATVKRGDFKRVDLMYGNAGWGRILTSLSTADGKHKTPTKEQRLVITQLPDKANSLAAVYFAGYLAHPFVLKADLWKSDRTFWMAGDGVQYVGKCE